MEQLHHSPFPVGYGLQDEDHSSAHSSSPPYSLEDVDASPPATADSQDNSSPEEGVHPFPLPLAPTSPPKGKIERVKLCQFEGCDKVTPSRTLCSRHQKQKERATKRGKLNAFMASVVTAGRTADLVVGESDENTSPLHREGSRTSSIGDSTSVGVGSVALTSTDRAAPQVDIIPKHQLKEEGRTEDRQSQRGDERQMGSPRALTPSDSSFDPKNFLRVEITHLLRLPQSEAAARLGLSRSTLSRIWRNSGPQSTIKWTHKQVIEIEKKLVLAREQDDMIQVRELNAQLSKLLAPAFLLVPLDKVTEQVEQLAQATTSSSSSLPREDHKQPSNNLPSPTAVRKSQRALERMKRQQENQQQEAEEEEEERDTATRKLKSSTKGHRRSNSRSPLPPLFPETRRLKEHTASVAVAIKESETKIKLVISKKHFKDPVIASLMAQLHHLKETFQSEVVIPEKQEPPASKTPVHQPAIIETSATSTSPAESPSTEDALSKARNYSLRDNKGRFARKNSLTGLWETTEQQPGHAPSKESPLGDPSQFNSPPATSPTPGMKKEGMVTRSSARKRKEPSLSDAEVTPSPPAKKTKLSSSSSGTAKKPKDRKKKRSSDKNLAKQTSQVLVRDSTGRFVSPQAAKGGDSASPTDDTTPAAPAAVEEAPAKEKKKEKKRKRSDTLNSSGAGKDAKSKKKKKKQKDKGSDTALKKKSETSRLTAKSQKRDSFGRFIRSPESGGRASKKREQTKSRVSSNGVGSESPEFGLYGLPSLKDMTRLQDEADDDDVPALRPGVGIPFRIDPSPLAAPPAVRRWEPPRLASDGDDSESSSSDEGDPPDSRVPLPSDVQHLFVREKFPKNEDEAEAADVLSTFLLGS